MIGYKHFESHSLKWRYHQGALLPLTPPHKFSNFFAGDAKKLLKEKGGYFLRWESSFDTETEAPWWHVIKSEKEAIDTLSSNTRSKVRRGLKKYECQVISKEKVLAEGYEVYSEAYQRYDTFEPMLSQLDFQRGIEELPEETEFFGVIEKGSNNLVAFSENYVEEGACFYLTIWFHPAHLRKYSSYALFHEMNKHYLNERELQYVSDGARSLSHDTNIHDFLIDKFGFRKAYSNLNVVYSPLIKLVTKSLYPFKNIIRRVPLNSAKKVYVLLEQEHIWRACKK